MSLRAPGARIRPTSLPRPSSERIETRRKAPGPGRPGVADCATRQYVQAMKVRPALCHPLGAAVTGHVPLHDHALLPWRFFPALFAADTVLRRG